MAALTSLGASLGTSMLRSAPRTGISWVTSSHMITPKLQKQILRPSLGCVMNRASQPVVASASLQCLGGREVKGAHL